MFAIAAMALILGNGQQQFPCPDFTAQVKATLMARYDKPYLPPPEKAEFATKACQIRVETNEYGNVTKVAPTNCSPSEIMATNKLLAGLQLPVNQAPGCGAIVLDMLMPRAN